MGSENEIRVTNVWVGKPVFDQDGKYMGHQELRRLEDVTVDLSIPPYHDKHSSHNNFIHQYTTGQAISATVTISQSAGRRFMAYIGNFKFIERMREVLLSSVDDLSDN